MEQNQTAKRGTIHHPESNRVRAGQSLLGDVDIHLFNEGTHSRLYERLGAHPMVDDRGREGTYFAVWAPNAAAVSVLGDFNAWAGGAHPLRFRDQSGVWEGFFPGVKRGEIYKYLIESQHQGYRVQKADPFAFQTEVPPKSASVVWTSQYDWADDEWMASRAKSNSRQAPISIYEIHLGSWQRVPEEGNRALNYREIAVPLAKYLLKMGYTHVELMPVTEHPYYGSWGYQTTGFFAPTSRYGAPEDLMFLIDHLHQHGIGVILDWVPSHFPSDDHGLAYFDGTHLYEHQDTRQGYHPDWKSLIFNYGRNEVRSFLLSSACYWLDRFHVDGLRVDAVASMLYLDYSRKEGEWIPNRYGGRENIEAIEFLRQLNGTIGREFPGTQTMAEESTAWPMVSRPPEVGGLGFHLKWDMGWMHDTLEYINKDPVHRKFHHHGLTFRMVYAFNENFVLPLSHDEVVHGKGSLLSSMPGDAWQKFANLRLLYGYMFGSPGKKLLFMGAEIAQWREWNHEESIDWHLLADPQHQGIQTWVRDLNHIYQIEPALHRLDCEPEGFSWIDSHDSDNSVLSFLRHDLQTGDDILVICNCTPVVRHGYRIGVPRPGPWRMLLNSDDVRYLGSGQGGSEPLTGEPIAYHGRPYSMTLTLPPLGVLFLKSPADDAAKNGK